MKKLRLGKEIVGDAQIAHDFMVVGWLSEDVIEFSKGLRKRILRKMKKRLSKKEWAIFTKSCNALFALGMSGVSEKEMEKNALKVCGFTTTTYDRKTRKVRDEK